MYLQTRDAVHVKKDLKHQIAANVKMATIELVTIASVSDLYKHELVQVHGGVAECLTHLHSTTMSCTFPFVTLV